MTLRFIAITFICFSLCGCTKNENGATEAKNTTSPSPASSPKSEEKKKGDYEGQSSDDYNDPDYFDVRARFKEEAEKYWNERFTKCNDEKNSSYERWFSVSETVQGKKYLEIHSLMKFTTYPYRMSYAQKLEKIWNGFSIIRGKALRWCENNGPCEKYQDAGGIMEDAAAFMISPNMQGGGGLYHLNLKMEKGKLELDNPASELYAPSCEEIKKQPIWIMP